MTRPATSTFVYALTDEALADRLKRIVADPRRWPRMEREAFILEAAWRLEGRP